MVKVKAEMDQFSDGMQTLQVLDFIKLYPEQMRPLFVATNNCHSRFVGEIVSFSSHYCVCINRNFERFPHC